MLEAHVLILVVIVLVDLDDTSVVVTVVPSLVKTMSMVQSKVPQAMN